MSFRNKVNEMLNEKRTFLPDMIRIVKNGKIGDANVKKGEVYNSPKVLFSYTRYTNMKTGKDIMFKGDIDDFSDVWEEVLDEARIKNPTISTNKPKWDIEKSRDKFITKSNKAMGVKPERLLRNEDDLAVAIEYAKQMRKGNSLAKKKLAQLLFDENDMGTFVREVLD